MRSESFRKALVYQKKYLLLLLGGFQECEEATLSLLTRMGGQPALSSLESINQRRRGLTRFRSAVRVSIALSRWAAGSFLLVSFFSCSRRLKGLMWCPQQPPPAVTSHKNKAFYLLLRMRFLVRRWHKTTGISAATSGPVSKAGAGQTPGELSALTCFISRLHNLLIYL